MAWTNPLRLGVDSSPFTALTRWLELFGPPRCSVDIELVEEELFTGCDRQLPRPRSPPATDQARDAQPTVGTRDRWFVW
jgi:hypothetical protein